MNDKNRVQIFDTTLRDGEQVPGCQLSTIEKIEIAKLLEELGVDVIEAGFPISSPGDFNSVVEISKAVNNPVICALTRARSGDIDAAAQSLQFAKRKRIHTGIGASDFHILNKFKSTRDKVLEQGVEAVKYARKFVDDIEFYAEDAGRADLEFLARMVEAVIAAGATVVNIPDTTGYCLPFDYGQRIKYLFENVPNIDKAIISVHCHNDLGLATANAIAGIINGARQVEVTVNGIGERAGNTSLEEVAMIIQSHKELELSTGINSKRITQVSRTVSSLMRMPVQPNKAIVGRNAFAHSSGIHQDGVLKSRDNYEIIAPQEVGINESSIILTARSGRAALRHHFERLGYNFANEELDVKYQEFLELADRVRDITDEDLVALAGGEAKGQRIELVRLTVACGLPGTQMARLQVKINGELYDDSAQGNGPVDAAINALQKIVKKEVDLEEFVIQAIHNGSNDVGKVHMQLIYNDNIYYGFGADTDIVLASLKAYIGALNKALL